MKMTRDKWMQFGITALINGILFTILCMIFNYFFNNNYAWFFYVFQGVFFGIFMAAWTMFFGKKK